MTIKRLKITSLILLFLLFFSANYAFSKTYDYDEVYSKLEEADFEYIFGLDPHQTDDYTKYMFSPYPLFRSGVNLVFKTKTIPPGYYLLTPREKNGKTYVLFKENGRVSYTIPVYDEDIVPETFYQEKIPRPIPTKSEKLSKKVKSLRRKVSDILRQANSPEATIRARKQVLQLGIPGDSLLKQPWAESRKK